VTAPPPGSTGILYLTYDGLLEPLGQSQVLAYQEQLAACHRIHVVSFEKPHDMSNCDALDAVARRVADAGISWSPLRYHKWPSALATSYDIAAGIAVGLWLVLTRRIRIVHARSYVAAVMALALKKLTGARFIFDMRGFWADERVDGGLWLADSRIFRVAKWFEMQFLLNADHVISLTHAGVRELRKFPYLRERQPECTVIPTCADLSLFRPATADKSRFVLGYVGSATTWYEFDAAVHCFAELLRRRSDALFLVINRNEHAYILERLAAGGVPSESVELRAASHREVPLQMARMDAAVFFIKPMFSKTASAPTKLGEFLGCGIPCLSNSGVGDMAEILQKEEVGVALEDLSDDSIRAGLERLLALADMPGIAARCVQAAHSQFSLEEGVSRYASVYRRLGAPT
jgi:glycosyltransferase involved in cell wall biosynthesis